MMKLIIIITSSILSQQLDIICQYHTHLFHKMGQVVLYSLELHFVWREFYYWNNNSIITLKRYSPFTIHTIEIIYISKEVCSSAL